MLSGTGTRATLRGCLVTPPPATHLCSRGVGNGIKPFITLHVLGLQDVAHTIVGDQMTRGVSGAPSQPAPWPCSTCIAALSANRIGPHGRGATAGGQRKRVTTAEVLVGPQNVLLCDEISTGQAAAPADAARTRLLTIVGLRPDMPTSDDKG